MDYFACVIITTIIWGLIGTCNRSDLGGFMLLFGVFLLVICIAMLAGARHLEPTTGGSFWWPAND